MFLLFFLLACESPKPTKQSQKVDVSFAPEIPGGVEVPLSELSKIIPSTASFSEEQKKRLWSALHLIPNPCALEKESLLVSLKTESCPASNTLLERALLNFSKTDNELLEVLTVPDRWFSHAKRGDDRVMVELWIEEGISVESVDLEIGTIKMIL